MSPDAKEGNPKAALTVFTLDVATPCARPQCQLARRCTAGPAWGEEGRVCGCNAKAGTGAAGFI